MKKRLRFGQKIITGVILFGAIACSSNVPLDQEMTAETSTVILYQTATLVAPTKTIEPAITSTSLPSPTPTPFFYTVVENDTLLAIAVRFGITLNELLAANPDLNPQFLSIGTLIEIPIPEDGNGILNTDVISIEQIVLGDVFCTDSATNGLWCHLMVSNDLGYSVDNVGVLIKLIDEQGEMISEKMGYLPINQLSSGSEFPILVYFPQIHGEIQIVQVELLSALPVTIPTRYISLVTETFSTKISQSGSAATWKGKIITSDIVPQYVTITLIAYDDQGNFLGMNQYEYGENQIDNLQNVTLDVYSIYGEIDTIVVGAEGRP